jgi:hypothetical protein
MPMMKSIQYSMFCENYWKDDGGCNTYEDYLEILRPNTPKKHFKKLGYVEIDGIWYCKDCAYKKKAHKKEVKK